MDDYLFQLNVSGCRVVVEETRYLEIFCYTDPSLDTVEENDLHDTDFDDFLYRRAGYAPSKTPPVSGVRLIVQENAKHPDTFSPNFISLLPDMYTSMVNAFNLPFRAIETTSCLGPLFWSSFNPNDGNPLLQIIYRKADVRKKGYTRGWEVILSHEINNGLTTGFCKGTPSSDIIQCLRHLRACARQTFHPLILPMIVISHSISFKTDIKQREARDWLRLIEHAAMSGTINVMVEAKETYMENGIRDLDRLSRDVVECSSQVLQQPPIAYLQILELLKDTMDTFQRSLPDEKWTDPMMQKIHWSLLSRFDFYKRRLLGIENYAKVTMQRLEIQRGVVNNLISQRDSKLNFEMAKDQRRVAMSSWQDASTMKTISVLGIIFLPGTFLASILSTTFFDFHGSPNLATAVSPRFWLFWAVDIPMTLTIIGIWYFWERAQAKLITGEVVDPEIEVQLAV